MLSLPDVTLVCYDVGAPRLASLTVEDCLRKAKFAAVHVWTDDPGVWDKDLSARAEFFRVDGTTGKVVGQADLWHQVPRRIETSHFLNLEWDAGIADPALWDPAFLDYDYVGAPWPFHEELTVGNGGFALASTRLFRFLADHPDDYPYAFPWDDTLCRRHRARLEGEGFTWAPEPLAARFAYEHGPLRASFGFHDSRNFPAFLPYAELNRRIAAVDDKVREHASWKAMLVQLRALSRNMEVTPMGAEYRPAHDAVQELHTLGGLLAKRRLFKTAVTVAQRAITVLPNSADLWVALASHYWNLRRYQEAYDCACRALSIDPKLVHGWEAAALALETLGHRPEAGAAYNMALAQDPEHHRTRWDRALFYLGAGDYESGFRDYEARLLYRAEAYPTLGKAPVWRGESLAGKSIYVQAEQGIGDAILFARFLPWLAAHAARVYVCWSLQVNSLLCGYVGGNITFVPEGVPMPETDYTIYLGSLPHRYGATVENLPPDPGFILKRVQEGGRKVEVPYPAGVPFKPFRVGICWRGNPAQDRTADRDVPLEQLFALAGDYRVWLYSLQCGPGQRDIERIGAEDFIVDPSDELQRLGLTATASAMLQLDLVVTCCTSVAHLAGALGLPAWVLIPEDPYWVWGHNTEETTPWWPTLRLFRQEKPHEWRPVIERVRDALTEVLDRDDRG
jgi:tetratricopeptide (TPR) repeat protein